MTLKHFKKTCIVKDVVSMGLLVGILYLLLFTFFQCGARDASGAYELPPPLPVDTCVPCHPQGVC